MAKKITTEDFIERANKIHNNNYDYSLVDYKNNKTKVKIKCNIHGIFEQLPSGHLMGKGCFNCNSPKRLNNKSFIEKAKKVHGNKYDYSLVEYITGQKKVKIICKKHGLFEQLPYSHYNGSGCKKCANEKHLGGYSEEYFLNNENAKIFKGSLYIVKLENDVESFIKIGITKHSAKQRTKAIIPYKSTTIFEYKTTLYNAFLIEQILHKKLKNDQYNPKIYFGGHSECFINIDEKIPLIINRLKSL